MGDISKNFSRREFACHCGCGFDTVDAELLHLLQTDIRDYYNQPVTILSGCRCFQHNLNTPGAASDSRHMEAKAADIIVCSVSPRALYHYLDRKYKKKYGLGLYLDRIHVDVRPFRARWKKC
ncbi:hypothetical protein DGMP_06750 [Desulfomarina profundi]|uniref:Peptidase M15A C-terminal domain-containing protein n=1 Tax=Desulfomarina profundi TaxID=2772557 RepID=A0A8D5FE90_9BACT|nr:D-Ala-D-Ala carboxypeptidase family metallohydrolase [Desulfomarina profundi]BCL59982.1 hypothetical protein DGMP_06750 [Desulfomarina profundi]